MPSDTKQKRGGLARASSLSPQRRVEIAREAAQLRWRVKRKQVEPIEPEYLDQEPEILEPSPAMPIARWRGMLNIVGIDVPCYVLDDGQKIIGRVSATEVLTGIKGGGALEKYCSLRHESPLLTRTWCSRDSGPFRLLEVEGLEKAVKGLPHDLMIEVCQGFVAALQSSFDANSPHVRLTDRQKEMEV